MKYTIDGSTLTDIADAIRTQYGEDSPIAVSDMAEAILGIAGGGGELPFGVSYTTLATESQTLTFEHDLGRNPSFCVVFPVNPNELIGKMAYKFVGVMFGLTSLGFCATSNSNALRSVATSSGVTFSNTNEVIALNSTNSTYKYATGIEYACIYM